METKEPQLCACCATNFEPTDTFCNACGYPLQGTKEQQDFHISNRIVKEIDLVDLNKKVKTATNSLYWIAAVLTLSTIITYFMIKDEIDVFAVLITNAILIAAFLAFGVWSKTKPAAALISGLSLYAIIHILNAVAEPTSLFQGILVKVLIIVYLIKGIIAVLEVDKIKKELNIK